VNITEAINIQTLLKWLTDPHQDGPEHTEKARAAAGYLADRAAKTLGAGPTQEQITELWDHILQGCSGCSDCVTAERATA
jgi:hypothetical protein